MLWMIIQLAKDLLLLLLEMFSINQFQSAYSKGHCHQTTGKLPGLPLCLFAKNSLSYT